MTKQNKIDKKDVPKLNYLIIHSQAGFSDGVSIVMKQIESVMIKNLKIPKKHVYYLVGKSKDKNKNTKEINSFWHKSKVNILANKHYKEGYNKTTINQIEKAIENCKKEIEKFVTKKKIDIIIAHNSSHPVNFIYSVALSRYYKEQEDKKTPKYILWWHDSHLERKRYQNPLPSVEKYLIEGVPGIYVDYFIFINGLQFKEANNYFLELNEINPGFYKKSLKNHTRIYNTATTPINKLEDLEINGKTKRVKTFLKDYKIKNFISENKLKLNEIQFCLQHTRIVPRKKIDFALKYSYKLFSQLQKEKKKKTFIFIISGTSGDEKGNYKKQLIKLNKKLSQEYKTNNFKLIFAEKKKKTNISFEEFPLIVAQLGGISTYFSEVEGFGNNLLEVLAAGLIPIIYTYPVFIKDIKKFKFKTINLEEFKITKEKIKETIKIIDNEKLRTKWADTNIKILKEKLSHKTIAPKLERAIIKER